MAIPWEALSSIISLINAGRNYKNSALSYPLKIGRAKGEKEPVSTILVKRSRAAIDTPFEMVWLCNGVKR